MAARTIGPHHRLFWLALTLILALANALQCKSHRVAGGCAGVDAEDDDAALALAVMSLALVLTLMLDRNALQVDVPAQVLKIALGLELEIVLRTMARRWRCL